MKIVLISMPDIAPIIMHEAAFHMPNNGIASIGANIDKGNDVYLIDLIRKRRRVRKYLTKTLKKIAPDIVGLSAMTWQYSTCIKIITLIKQLFPRVKIVIGGYHATLMHEDIASSDDAGLIDFIVRGEGEEAFRRLVNAVRGEDDIKKIPSLSYRDGKGFTHNPMGGLLDLSRLKVPIRDKRRLTSGYHIMTHKIEVLETSRGCTRACKFCSMSHMYGRSFRPFPIDRVLEDLDDIYYKRGIRWVFITDDNMVLDPDHVIAFCDAVIRKRYGNLNLVVQADCIIMSKNEKMVCKMSEAGFRSIFLGIENVSKKNLMAAGKGNIVEASRKAVAMCHKYKMMVVGGMIFGFPDDDESDIIENYRFLKSVDADTAYCQILTPYPKTVLRQQLLDENLVTNMDDFRWYNGLWANVRTKHLDSGRLQYLFWYHREIELGWWEPSERMRSGGWMWTAIWVYAMRPLLKIIIDRSIKKQGWEGRHRKEIKRLKNVNYFSDLEDL
ncbi:MAG: B12-binding domain-containing radical SAM protein [Deltaproteobacteria bacterium]|nr:B12-binding domain-containing radical SAM protein [Deltaproteobacteria bacterium]